MEEDKAVLGDKDAYRIAVAHADEDEDQEVARVLMLDYD